MIQYRSHEAPASSVDTVFTANKPTGVVAGDFMIMQAIGGRFEVPSGWLVIPHSEIYAPGDIGLYYRVAGGSEPATYSITSAAATTGGISIIAFYSDTATPIHIDVIAQQRNAVADTNRVWPSVTVIASASMLCCFGAIEGGSTSTPAAGFTERWDLGNPRRYMMHKALAVSGATGTTTATGTAEESNCVTLALAEGSAQSAFDGPQYRGNSFATMASVNGSVAVAAPATLVVGDIMLMDVVLSASKVLTPPAGWVAVADISTTNIFSYLFSKIAEAGDIASVFTTTFAAGSITGGASVVAWSSPNGRDMVVDDVQVVATASSTTHNFPTVTTTEEDAGLTYFGLFNSSFSLTIGVGAALRSSNGSTPKAITLTAPEYGAGVTSAFGVTSSSAELSALITVAVVEITVVAPDAPSGLFAAANGSTRIDLIWSDDSVDEDNFELERSDDGLTGWALIASPLADTEGYSNTGLTASTEYFYRIRAVNTGGESAWSDVASATTDATPAADSWQTTLDGSAIDDGLPNPPAALTYVWTVISGPGEVVFEDDTDPVTGVSFDTIGTYVLRLTASDGALFAYDEVTITTGGPPTAPRDDGLRTGQELVVGIGPYHAYRTFDFQTLAGSGGPTWETVTLAADDTEEILSWVVDPFSPGYLTGAGAINGWYVTHNTIYRVVDFFGTTIRSAVHTFAVDLTAADHMRSIQASFGTYFVEGLNPWMMVVSYYGDTSGHEGTWCTFSVDGGVTWSAEVQVSEFYDTALSVALPIGLYLSPKTPGLAYTAAFTQTSDPAIACGYVSTDWGVTWESLCNITDDPLSPIWAATEDFETFNILGQGQSAGYRLTVTSPPGSVTKEIYIVCAPPPNAKEIDIDSAVIVTVHMVPTSNSFATTPLQKDASLSVSDASSSNPPTEEGTVTKTASGTYTKSGVDDWPLNNVSILLPSPTGSSVNQRVFIGAHAYLGENAFAEVKTFTLISCTRILLEDDTEYVPVTSSPIMPQEGFAGQIHLPWPDNDTESLIYYGALYRATRRFALMQAIGETVTDISPVDSGVTYGVNHGHFAVRAYDSDRQYMALGGRGATTSVEAGDQVGLWLSVDAGVIWSNIFAPVAASTVLRGLQIAFAGDTPDTLFAWGGWADSGHAMFYSIDFGVTLLDKTGNLEALEDVEFGAIAYIGIAGGPVAP